MIIEADNPNLPCGLAGLCPRKIMVQLQSEGWRMSESSQAGHPELLMQMKLEGSVLEN